MGTLGLRENEALGARWEWLDRRRQVYVVGEAKDRALRTQCMSNLHQIGIALQVYAGDNNDKLPQYDKSGATRIVDVPYDAGNQMLQNVGGKKKVFYDPGKVARFPDEWCFSGPVNYWDFNTDPNTGWHVTGYAFIFGGKISEVAPAAQNTTIQPESSANPLNSLLPPVRVNVSDRELFACATMCSVPNVPNNARYTTANNTYTQIPGQPGYPLETSPHLKGAFPSGGNVGFKDMHVSWRKFDNMSQWAASGPSFWW